MTALPHQTSGHDLAMTPAVAASAATVGDYFQLMKPRVMSLVIFTGLAGIYLAPGEIHLGLAIVSLLAIAAGAGAAGESRAKSRAHRFQRNDVAPLEEVVQLVP